MKQFPLYQSPSDSDCGSINLAAIVKKPKELRALTYVLP